MIILSNIIITEIGQPIRRNAAIVIHQDKVVAVGPQEKILRSYPNTRAMRFDQAVLMPGLINVHTHLELPQLPLTVRSRDYAQWVLNLLRAKRALRTPDYRRAAKKNIHSLIETGTTTVGEICTHGVSPQELLNSGVRSVIYHELVSMGPMRALNLPPLLSRQGRSRGLLRYGLSPHSPHTVSESALRAIRDRAATKNLPLCMHVAETKDETLLLQGKKSGLDRLYAIAGWLREWAPHATSPLEYLDRIGVLGPRLLVVHAVHVNGQDIKLLRASGTAVAHCPRSNYRMRVGTMPLRGLLAAGIRVGLGTDSLASVPSLSLWDEMRFAYKIHQDDDITPLSLLYMATMGGASALGMENDIGSLRPGKKADLVILPLPVRSTGDLYSDLLKDTKSCIMTMVNGKILHRAKT
jgi:5-methylthioadenosine/S-adenosylhomocysteine deaminase